MPGPRDSEITRAIADYFDVICFFARKPGLGRVGGICIRDEARYRQMRGLVPMYEVFRTHGGKSVREMEAITVGLDETMDEDMINQGPSSSSTWSPGWTPGASP